MPIKTSHDQYPPFSTTVPTAPLVSISLAKLEASDAAESSAFFEAAQNLGFFYLSMEGSELGEKLVDGAEKLLALQKEFFSRPNEEKEQFAREKIDPFFGYRHGTLKETWEDGRPKRNETYNLRKDDLVRNNPPLPMHPLVTKNHDLLESYARNCRAAIDLMITHLEVHLQLPIGTLAKLHRINHRSGDHVRFHQHAPAPFTEEAAKQGEHTDFGTLTILFNWLGGLQIRLPDTEDWVYVKPVPGSAVVNLGDALVKFTAGILRSNVHRVTPPPAPQDGITRNSLVFFSRPEDTVVLKRIEGGIIDKQPREEKSEPEMTSEEWILRRSVGDLKGVYTHKGGLEIRRQLVAGRV
ncbi:Clavaminate synthase-like protein [Rhizodiscina lignyota]|uniref:Clavaminate synthase-like protein n=1 Tax=Rhizodiscina lignyota TaxID=1504668 RepID=A0A9P4IP95_9PEZI|nr:Clavaminate synthase-like protein [Rhizodiscina lignyota]